MSQSSEDARPNALSRNQVQLGIDSGKHPALLADLATAISGEIAERLQYQADLVEVIGDGVAREAIRAFQPGVFPLELLRPFRPAQMRLAVRAAVAGMSRTATEDDQVVLEFRDRPRPGGGGLDHDRFRQPGATRQRDYDGCGVLRIEMFADFDTARTCGGVGKSVTESRRTWRSSVSTSGRGVS